MGEGGGGGLEEGEGGGHNILIVSDPWVLISKFVPTSLQQFAQQTRGTS